jgi:GrpB-like predicted nucleotidyltransferase (UPF0157 family)
VSAARTTHTVDGLLALLDEVFAGERDRSSVEAAPWWDRFYSDPDQAAPFLTSAPDESLAGWVEHGPVPTHGRALDIGCGVGRNAVHLARHGFAVDAVDLSPVAIARTRLLAEHASVTVDARAADLFAEHVLSGRYDLVHDSGLFHHLPPHRRLSHLALLDRVLAPGGYFSLTCFGAAPMASEVPDVELYRSGDLGGGLSYPAASLRTIFGHLEEVELRPMRDEPPTSGRFGEPFLWAALFRRPRPDDPLTDDALAELLVHGPQPVWVTLSEYDPAWPERFEVRARQLRQVLGDRAQLIEHIGSTSVPGLAAKPTVDIVVGVEDPDDEGAYLPDLRTAGYDLRVREPQHRCLRTGEPDEPVNLHIYPPEHAEVRKYLLFRDRLRSDAGDRQLYESTKRGLTDREWPDMNYYAEAKGPVIEAILGRAGRPG